MFRECFFWEFRACCFCPRGSGGNMYYSTLLQKTIENTSYLFLARCSIFRLCAVPVEAYLVSSEGFPSGYLCVCVRLRPETPNLRCRFRKRRLRNTPCRHRLAGGQLSPLYRTLPNVSSFGAASAMLCCCAPPAVRAHPYARLCTTRGSVLS